MFIRLTFFLHLIIQTKEKNAGTMSQTAKSQENKESVIKNKRAGTSEEKKNLQRSKETGLVKY